MIEVPHERARLARVVVVGTSGSGKTTFARSLAAAFEVPHIELDALYWGPNWTPRSPAEFSSRVRSAIEAPAWVVDGNYASVRPLVWRRASALVWLNYSFPRVFSRALSRTIRRSVTGEEVYGGNRESFSKVVDPEWIPWWVIRTFRRYRRETPLLIAAPEFAHLQVSEFRKPSQAEGFLVARR